MKTRTRLASIAFAALASLAALPAFAQGTEAIAYARPVAHPAPVAVPVAAHTTTMAMARPVVIEQRTQIAVARPTAEARAFASQASSRMQQIQRELTRDVNRGRVRAQAIVALQAKRAQFDAALSQAMRDGVIARAEARMINGLIGEAAELDAQFTVRRGNNGRGNGAGPRG